MEHKALKKELLTTLERLAKYVLTWQKNNPNIIQIFKKIEKKGKLTLTSKERIAVSEYFEMAFYEGKLMAYIFVMQELFGKVKDEKKGKQWTIPAKTMPYFVFWFQNSCGLLAVLHKPVVPCTHIDAYLKKHTKKYNKKK